MTRNARRFDDLMNRAFAPFRDIPREHVDAACDHVLHDLREEPTARTRSVAMKGAPEGASYADDRPRSAWLRPALACAAAVTLVVAVVSRPGVRELVVDDAPAIAHVEPDTTEGGVYVVPSGERLRPGAPIRIGDVLRTNGGTGAVVRLDDGSRIEMRSKSELSLEHAADGVRIRLNQGDIIVDAAKQRAGHLYVQTKDLTVSVVGTVFLVNAEDAGSRVAVIEGEVRVQQGTSEKKLLPGEQMATSPAMKAAPVKDAIAWSRSAGPLLVLLQQSTLIPPPTPATSPAGARETFEVISIRLRGNNEAGVRGGGPGDAAGGGGRVPACGGGMDLDPRRVNVRGYTLYRLITLAYGGDCFRWELMSNPAPLEGGPEWIKSVLWDIEALIPQGALPYTPRYVDIGGGRTAQQHVPGPRLQMMFQALLETRFGLVLRRETRQGLPMFALTVAQGGPKLTPWKDGDPVTEREMIDLLARNHTLLSEQELSRLGVTAAEFADRWAKRTIEFSGPGLLGVKASMSNLAAQLEGATLWPVVDRTGIKGEFNYRLPPYRNPAAVGLQPRLLGGGSAPGTEAFEALAGNLEKQLGLKVESSRGPRDVLVIERVERPTEN